MTNTEKHFYKSLDVSPDAREHRIVLRFWLSLIAAAIFGVVNLGWSITLWHAQAEMKTETQLQQKMLTARARVQLLLIESAKENRALTADEQAEIDTLTIDAQYFTTPTP